LILPALLVASQFASMQLMQPKTEPGAEPAQGQAILKFLPLMIGWFSLNVPSALCIYWITNNVVTTASSVFIRNNVAAAAAAAGPVTMSAPVDSTSTESKSGVFAAPREKPSGFGASAASVGSDGVKPITSIDAEIQEPLDYDDDDEDDSNSAVPSKKKRGKKAKKQKKN
jgi:YidC/Oxa1 family membrane protein insertase